MQFFQEYGRPMGTAAALDQLAQHPELWGQIPYRKALAEHAEMDDIWLRYRPLRDVERQTWHPGAFWCEFYPAWRVLTEVHALVWEAMHRVQATHLGAVLITRIPPGGSIHPHNDAGMWHADFHNAKVYIPLTTNPQVTNYAEDEEVVMGEGEFWRFNNLVTHSLENRGKTDRISLIVAMRHET